MATKAAINAALLEKRRWRRLHFTVPVRVTLEKSRHISVIDSRGSQVNPGGIAFFADTELAIGDEAEILLTDYHLRNL